MAVAQIERDASHAKRSGKDAIEYRIIFLVSFVIFFFAALIEMLLPWRWLFNRNQRTERRSVFEQAKDAAGTCTTYAFMG